MFKQFFQAGAIDVCQLDGCRLGGRQRGHRRAAPRRAARRAGVPARRRHRAVRARAALLDVRLRGGERQPRRAHDRVRRPPPRAHGPAPRRRATAATGRRSGPGLGVELEPASLARYRYPDGDALERRGDACASRSSAGRCTTGSTTCSPDDVEVVVHADHPTLNREVAERLGGGGAARRHLHARQVRAVAGRLAPPARRPRRRPTCSAGSRRGRSTCAASTARCCARRATSTCGCCGGAPTSSSAAPATWDDVEAAPGAFGFTGRESGLFGLFYELMAGAGGPLFDDDAPPDADRARRRVAAVERLQRLAAKAPDDLPGWHYDDVDDALLGGRVAMAAAWPGGYDRIRRSDARRPPGARPRYPGGRSYSGCHGWAIPAHLRRRARRGRLVDPALLGARRARARPPPAGVPANLGALAGPRAGRRRRRASAGPSPRPRSTTPCSPTRRSSASPRWRTPGGARSTTRCAARCTAAEAVDRDAGRRRGDPVR